METAFWIGLGMIFLFIVGIAVWLVRDYIKEPRKEKDYPFKHKN